MAVVAGKAGRLVGGEALEGGAMRLEQRRLAAGG